MILSLIFVSTALRCSATSLPPDGGIAFQWQSWLNSNNGNLVGNGNPSLPRKRTYMALIGTGPEDDKEWICGGSLIAPRFILSAAHCSNTKSGLATWVRVGDLDVRSIVDDARPRDRRIVEIIHHPLYKENENYHDIALYRLEHQVYFDTYVQPVCLYKKNGTPVGKGIVAGWGRIEFAGPLSHMLLEAAIDFYNDTECQRLKGEISNLSPRGIDSKIMFCAGKADGSHDSCPGDSGGPLVIKREEDNEPKKPEEQMCEFVQVGVVSYGEMCLLPDSPGVYTRVSAYVDWIENQLSRFPLTDLLV